MPHRLSLCNAYLRVSTMRQAKKGVSLLAQKEEIRGVARKIGASIIYWFIDTRSGVSFVERKLNAIYRLAELGLIDKVVCRDIDRMGRESYLLLAFIIMVRALGVTTVVPSGELDVKRCGDMIMAAIKSVLAEEENVKRTKSALSSKIYNFIKERKWNIPVPLGYKKTTNGWIQKIPEFESVIKNIFELFLILQNYKKVAEHINNNEHARSLIGKSLTGEVVARLLTNPVYIGRPQCGKERTKQILCDTKLEVEDPSLRFIDNETFEKAQKIIARKKGEYRRKEKPLEKLCEILNEDVFYVFDNVAFLCPICRTPMINNGQFYKCPKCSKQRRLIKRSELERLAECILKRKKALDVVCEIFKRFGKTNNIDDIIEKLRRNGINLSLA